MTENLFAHSRDVAKALSFDHEKFVKYIEALFDDLSQKFPVQCKNMIKKGTIQIEGKSVDGFWLDIAVILPLIEHVMQEPQVSPEWGKRANAFVLGMIASNRYLSSCS